MVESSHLIEKRRGGGKPLPHAWAVFEGLAKGFGGVGLAHTDAPPLLHLLSLLPSFRLVANRKPALGLQPQDEKAALPLPLNTAWLATACRCCSCVSPYSSLY